MPKVQLYEEMGPVIDRVVNLVATFLEVGTVLLYAFQKEEELMWLNSSTIFRQL